MMNAPNLEPIAMASKSDYRSLMILLAFTAVYSFIGFDWGMANTPRTSQLFDQDKNLVLEKIKATTDRIGFLVNLAVFDREENPRDLPFDTSIQRVSLQSNTDDLFRVYRHYSLYSERRDVSVTF